MSTQLVGTIAGLSRGVFSLDFAPGGEKMVVAGADAAIRIIDIYDHVPGDKARERPITPSIKCANSIVYLVCWRYVGSYVLVLTLSQECANAERNAAPNDVADCEPAGVAAADARCARLTALEDGSNSSVVLSWRVNVERRAACHEGHTHTKPLSNTVAK